MKIIIPLLVLLSGICSGIMVATNARLKESLGSPALTTAIVFAIGSLFMFAVAATGVAGKNEWKNIETLPWWAWTGGVLSIIAVALMVFAKDAGGGSIALILAATVVGQQVVGLALAHFGWLGTDKEPINGWKIAGFVLLVGGALLMGKK